MQLNDTIRMYHMLDAARIAVNFMTGVERETLETDLRLVLAIIKAVEIIGEAATNITRPVREQYPQIPWNVIVGMRNRLVHGYFDIDYDQVWSTVKDDLPPLLAQLESILPPAPPDYKSLFV
jgi:uncharacterized protein with HEPN domain